MKQPTKRQIAINTGRSLAKHHFQTFYNNPEFRGEKFVWPTSLYDMVSSWTSIQCTMDETQKYEKEALKAAKDTLDELVAQSKTPSGSHIRVKFCAECGEQGFTVTRDGYRCNSCRTVTSIVDQPEKKPKPARPRGRGRKAKKINIPYSHTANFHTDAARDSRFGDT